MMRRGLRGTGWLTIALVGAGVPLTWPGWPRARADGCHQPS